LEQKDLAHSSPEQKNLQGFVKRESPASDDEIVKASQSTSQGTSSSSSSLTSQRNASESSSQGTSSSSSSLTSQRNASESSSQGTSSSSSSLTPQEAQLFSTRLQDLSNESLKALNPIEGIQDQELVSLPEAAKSFRSIIQVDVNIQVALDRAEQILDEGTDQYGLTLDEIACIHLYTQQSKFYKTLNAHLRAEDRSKIFAFFPYLRLMSSAMNKLPKVTEPLWRGVPIDISLNYPEKKKFYWWGFSSTTTDIKLLKSEQFLGPTKGTLFMITCTRGRSIARYSAIPAESEVLLPPGIRFLVKGCIEVGGAHLVTLEESGLVAYS